MLWLLGWRSFSQTYFQDAAMASKASSHIMPSATNGSLGSGRTLWVLRLKGCWLAQLKWRQICSPPSWAAKHSTAPLKISLFLTTIAAQAGIDHTPGGKASVNWHGRDFKRF